MDKWKDTSSRTQRESSDSPSSAFTLTLPAGRLVVHRYVGCKGWFASLYGVGMELRPLKSEEPAAACEEARVLVLERMKSIVKEIEEAHRG